MAEYILTPENRDLPSALELMEELHRRGFPVEIHLTGEDREWRMVRFFEAGPPEISCSLSRDSSGFYKIFVSRDASPSAGELQVFLVDTLLQKLGGQVDNSTTRERFTREQFTIKVKNYHSSAAKAKDWVWIAFSWGVVALALGVYFAVSSGLHNLVLVILVFSFLSATLQTYSLFKNG